MTEAPKLLTLEQIQEQFPPQRETFYKDSKEEEKVVAMVSRNYQGVILYVVPGSIGINRFPGLKEEDRQELLKITIKR